MARKSGKEASLSLAHGPYQRLLPDNVIPDNYLICLKPNWENLCFEGSEIVHLTINKDVKEVTLHATDLTIGKIMWVEDQTDNCQEPISCNIVNNELLKIIFEPPLNPSQGSLRINYTGLITAKGSTKGLFKTKQTDDVATNFETQSAHRCFPCWDEPGMKATFDLCLIIPKELTAMSNMPVKVAYAHRSKQNLHVVEFSKTPPMSTYSLSFCVGTFDFISDQTPENVLCRVYTGKGNKKLGRFALDLAMKILPFYSSFFGCNYPLPKLDLIGLSETLSGGIGRWGVISLRDANLYVDEHSSGQFLQSLSLLIAHELAYSWFGNLVSMQWPNSFWLKESFTTFMEYFTVDHFSPHFEIWPQFICNCFIKAMELDCNRFAHAIEMPTNTGGDLVETNDPYMNFKGAALIRMLYNYICEQAFCDGMALFVSRHQFKNAKSEDFWRVLSEVSGKPIEGMMNSWMRQSGYPLVKVSTKQEGNYRLFTLTQEKFQGELVQRDNRGSIVSKDKDLVWTIPITFSSKGNPELHKVIMEKKTITVSISIGKAHWVNINPGLHGFFRVRYSHECFTQFLSAVRQRQLPVIERIGILSDLFAMTQNGQSSTVEILSVLEAYIEETNYSVWKLMTCILQKLNLLLEYTDFHGKFLSYTRFILSNIEEKTKWESKDNEGHLVTLRRGVILSMMIFLNDEGTLAEAHKRYELHAKGELNIPPDLRTLVYSSVLREGDEETVKAMFKMYRESEWMEEKDRIAKSLGSVKNVDKVKMILDFSISEDIQSQHTIQIISTLSSSKTGRELSWIFLKEHWKLFHHRYSGGGGLVLSSIVKCITENFVTDEKAVEVAEFFKDHYVGGLERTVLVACEKIKMNEAWLKRDSSFIQDYLSIYKSA